MKKHSYSLDAFRVLAIFGVFFSHLNFYNEGLRGEQTLLEGAVLNIGGLAAHFFILLSAFLIAYSYEKGMSCGYMTYVKKRARRLLPVNIVTLPFYITVVVYIGFYTLSLGRSVLDIILSSLLLQELFKFSAKLFNTPSWTISTLFILYLITPLLMWPLQRIRKPWIFIAIVVLLTWGDVEYRTWLTEIKPDNWWLNYASPINRILSYTNGLVLGCAARVCVCPSGISRHITWIEFVIFGIFFYGCALIEEDYETCHYLVQYTMPMLIALCYIEKGMITRFIAASKINEAAPYVYAFYMSHFFFILLAYTICDRVLGIWGNISMMQVLCMVVVTFVSACAASVLLHHCVEKRIA